MTKPKAKTLGKKPVTEVRSAGPELRWTRPKPQGNAHSHTVKVKALATVLRNRVEAFLRKPVKDLKPAELNLIRLILEW